MNNVRRSITGSLEHRVLLFVIPALVVGFIALIVYQTVSERRLLISSLLESNISFTVLMANAAAIGINDNDEAAIEHIYYEHVFTEESTFKNIVSILALDLDGDHLKSYLSIEHLHFAQNQLDLLGTRAIAENSLQQQFVGDVHVIAVPASIGRYELQTVGAIVIAWETRDILSSISQRTLNQGAIAAILSSMLLCLIILLLRYFVVRPISLLSMEVEKIGNISNSSNVVINPKLLNRNDEIGFLARKFEKTFQQLKESQSQLFEQSYYSGMAEMAAGVIHNIRNALSPIAVILWRISNQAKSIFDSQHFDRALGELADETVLPARKVKLIEYLAKEREHQTKTSRALVEELRTVERQNHQIENILNAHTELSLKKRNLEAVALYEMIEDAACVIPDRGSNSIELSIDPALRELSRVSGNRIILIQIFGNFIINAAEAIAEQGGTGKIHVSGEERDDNGRRWVRISVVDTGSGIEPQDLEKLFERGFSTKNHKHGGLGLHWCATSINSLGGKIYAESCGQGKGAEFHVVLPVHPSNLERDAA